MRSEGTAVLLLASDLDEALELSDRLAVISRGSLSEIRKTSGWDRREVAGLIAGGRQ
jgi:simple sugar transport system ATP-binding protein